MNTQTQTVEGDRVPDGWQMVRLGDVAVTQKGDSFTSKELVPGDVPVIAGGRVPAYYHDTANRLGGTITVSGSGAHAGFVAFHNTPIFATDCTTVRAHPTDSKTTFIYHALKHNEGVLYNIRSGSAQPHVYPRDIAALPILLPPLPEQRRIAAVLDAIDDAIERTEAVIAATERLRGALLHDLLTVGVPGWHSEWHEVSGLGVIPADWEVVRLEDVAEVVGGSTPRRDQDEYWGGNIPWVVPSELTALRGRYLTDARESITVAGMGVAGLRIIPDGSVLLTSRATIGVVAVNAMPVTTNQGFQSLIPRSGTDNLWLYYWVSSMRHELEKRGAGSTFREVSRDSVRGLPLCLLPE